MITKANFSGKGEELVKQLLVCCDFEITPLEYQHVEKFMDTYFHCPEDNDKFTTHGFESADVFKTLLVKADLYNSCQPSLTWDPVEVETLNDYVTANISKVTRHIPDAQIPEFHGNLYEWMIQFEMNWLFVLGW
jgi:hypothetical protein